MNVHNGLMCTVAAVAHQVPKKSRNVTFYQVFLQHDHKWQKSLLDYELGAWMSGFESMKLRWKHVFLTYRVCRWVWYRFGPSPLWSRTGCTISEPDPNSARACGVSGAQTFPARLKRRVSKAATLTCCSVQRAYLWVFLDFLNESTSGSNIHYLSGLFTISLLHLYLCKLSDNAEMVPFIWVFFMPLSAHHWQPSGYPLATETDLIGLCVESKNKNLWWDTAYTELIIKLLFSLLIYQLNVKS